MRVRIKLQHLELLLKKLHEDVSDDSDGIVMMLPEVINVDATERGMMISFENPDAPAWGMMIGAHL